MFRQLRHKCFLPILKVALLTSHDLELLPDSSELVHKWINLKLKPGPFIRDQGALVCVDRHGGPAVMHAQWACNFSQGIFTGWLRE